MIAGQYHRVTRMLLTVSLHSFQGLCRLCLAALGVLSIGGCMPTVSPTHTSLPMIVVKDFGTLQNGEHVDEYTLSSGNGVTASILTWGGIIRSLSTPDRHGRTEDIVLGFDSLSAYEERHPYFGTITGRVANRIAKGRFSLEGKTYSLAINNGPNHLHGGINGFDRKNWKARTETSPEAVSLILSHVSPDGDEGYPGAVSVEVRYTMSATNALRIDYRATTTKTTPINLTNHAYFNLAGHASGDILHQNLQIFADSYVPVDETLIPIGTISPVQNTPFDFRQPHPIGEHLAEVGIGYDHNFVLGLSSNGLRRAAYAWDPASGRSLEVTTTQPGIQFYTGNYLSGKEVGKGGIPYTKHAGFCLETQGFPDAINQPGFPSTVLKPGEEYAHTTILSFSSHN